MADSLEFVVGIVNSLGIQINFGARTPTKTKYQYPGH